MALKECTIEPVGRSLRIDVRMAAVQSLGKIGGTGAKEVLKRALSDNSPGVCLKVLGTPSFLCDTSAVEPLFKALRDKNKEVLWSAADDLGYLGGGDRVAERMIRVALENTNDDIQKETTHALEIMREEREHEVLYSECREG